MDVAIKHLDTAGLADERAGVLGILVHDAYAAGRDAVSRLIKTALDEGEFQTKAASVVSYRSPEGFRAARVLLVGVGDRSPASIRQGLAAFGAQAKALNSREWLLGSTFDWSPKEATIVATALSDLTYSYTATRPKAEARQLQRVTLAAQAGVAAADGPSLTALVAGVELAKEWANRPANHATPRMLAGAAKALARHRRVRCKVLGRSEIERLGMGSFLAVAQGSEQPPQFIVLEYRGGPAKQAPVVLVGKGITFDTGGISLKPAAEMDEMKFDMGGAASVLGTFETLGRAQPAINVVGLIPACENMPGGRAVKPGDVVRSLSGQMIEILNTDAEGRLILCDALTYAERYKPEAVIDIATLTGACVVALGNVRSGLFANSEPLAAALQAAGERSGDPCWRMPLDDEYAEGLKTNFADVANVAGRWGGAVTAAKFLQRFVGQWPWAHLDIAGTAWKTGAAKGATGRPVPLLVSYLLDRAALGRSAMGGTEGRAEPAAKTRTVVRVPKAKPRSKSKGSGRGD